MRAKSRKGIDLIPTVGGDLRHDDAVMRVAEVATWAGVTHGTVYRWCYAGSRGFDCRVRLHFNRLGGITVTSMRHVRAFMYALEHGLRESRMRYEFAHERARTPDTALVAEEIVRRHGLDIPVTEFRITPDSVSSSVIQTPVVRSRGRQGLFNPPSKREMEVCGAQVDTCA